jgi:hypothetical protein
MVSLRFEAFGPARARTPFVPPPGMRLQEYVLAYDEGRRSTVYIAAHDHGAAFGDAYLFDGKSWVQVAKGATSFATTQKLGGFYDEARAGVATWNFEHDYTKHRYVAKGLLFDFRNGLSPITARGDDPIAEHEGETSTGTFDYMGLFAPDPRRALTTCLTRRGVWELDADAIWRKCADHDASFPRAWDDDGAGATFDPVRRRAVFWLYTREPREYAFFAWDGKTLERISTDGLPMKSLHIGLFDPAALIAAHPEHGLVLVAGEHGTFAFAGDRWVALPAPRGDAPPRMKNGRMVFDANVGGLVVGPGYHEGDPGGQDQQRVFYVERKGTWERMGVRALPSRLAEIAPDVRHVNSRGVWYAIGTRDLRTLRWHDADFADVAPKIDLGPNERVIAAADARGTPMALTNHGALWAFEDRAWTPRHEPLPAFGDRAEAALAWDIAGERLVAFSAGDTFFFFKGVWTKAKKRDAAKEDVRLLYDGALGRVVRFAADGVALLEGNAWTHVTPAHYAELCGPRLWQRFPAHDAKTGETVLVNLARRAIVRFDVTACEDIATIELPDDVDVETIRETLSFERSTRLLHAQNPARTSQRLALDLGPAFDDARSLGPREVPARPTREVVAVAARLYHPKKRAFWFVEGDLAHTASIGEPGRPQKVPDTAAAINAKKKNGFVPAEKLPLSFLAKLAAIESRALRVGKTIKPSASRAGGTPSIAPKSRPEGMTFVFQLEAKKLLRKHVGVAVFANDEQAKAVLVKKWVKAPPSRPITAASARLELDDARVHALVEADPAMAAAFERFGKRAKLQGDVTSKIGGNPRPAVEIPADYTFIAQLEIDGRVFYVFVERGENDVIVTVRPSAAR